MDRRREGDTGTVKVSPFMAAAETVHAGTVSWMIGRIYQCCGGSR